MAEAAKPFPRRQLNTTMECANCGRYTWHDLVGEYERRMYSADPDEYEDAELQLTLYRTIECRGCHDVSFLRLKANAHEFEEFGDLLEAERFPKIARERRPASAAAHLPARVLGVYNETLTAYNINTPLLCAAGIRATIEAVCQDQKCAGADLKERIDALVTAGALSAQQADILHLLRFMGNEAVHEIAEPTALELRAALEVAETLLANLYELPKLADTLRVGRQKRRNPIDPGIAPAT